MTAFIHLPGIGGSGPSHWQSRWERADPSIRRFSPESWDHPDLADWISALDQAVREAATPPVLVAHSLACLLVAHWQRASSLPIRGAFLVAVPDPGAPAFPAEAAAFADPPRARLRFPTLVVASTDDPYASVAYATSTANQWGDQLAIVGAAGHINGQSGLGDWPEGRSLLKAFTDQALAEGSPVPAAPTAAAGSTR